MKCTVNLVAVADVKTFVGACIAAPFEVDVVSDHYVVSGKSLMGIFALDLSTPVEVTYAEGVEDKYEEAVKTFSNTIKDFVIE